MARLILTRILSSIPVLFGVATIVFFLMRILPTDPAKMMLYETGASASDIAQLRRQLGLDQPIYIQYLHFLFDIVRGNFGQSFYTKQQVTTMLLQQMPATLELAVAGLFVSTVLGGTLGVLAAIRQGSWIDTVSMVFALTGVSMPSFWLGLMLIFFLSLKVQLLPSVGTGGIKHLILPAFTLGIGGAGIVARLIRSSMLEVMRQEYVVTARAKGLSESRVTIGHSLRNALIPAVTIIGLQFGYLLGGTVVVETVFARQGIGRLAVTAITGRDFNVIQGWALFVAVVYIVVNLLVDISYAWLDPRVRYG
ncbi:MAG TPA: nickel ABC transporter permease [Nitrolancea sp.]|nr:nickel ABC transporter permease [Nitrolancea sp.]